MHRVCGTGRADVVIGPYGLVSVGHSTHAKGICTVARRQHIRTDDITIRLTLRGKVLPIGGVKEKILAAKRAGITDLVLCQDNRKDVEDIAQKYLKGLSFHYVKDIQEVIDFALL